MMRTTVWMAIVLAVGVAPSASAEMVEQQADNLRRQGFRIRYSVEKNQVHRLKAQELNLSARLFDQIEGC